METTVAYAPKILSGVDVIDEAWGGFYRCGSYLVYGRSATGRGLLTMMFVQTGAQHEERCLFISPDRPKDLMIQAASIGFDLREAYSSGLVKLMRIPPMLNLEDVGDEGVLKALDDLVSIIRQNRPDRLVINDFMPFVQFRSFERFRDAFADMLEQIDSLDTTMKLVMAEPANQESRRIIDYMRSQMTGAIHIELVEGDASSTLRRLTLVPNIGHIKRRVVEFWDLEDVVNDREDGSSASPRMLPKKTGGPSEPLFSASASAGTQLRLVGDVRVHIEDRPVAETRSDEGENGERTYSAPAARESSVSDESNESTRHANASRFEIELDVSDADGIRPHRLGESAEPAGDASIGAPFDTEEPRIRAIPLGRRKAQQSVSSRYESRPLDLASQPSRLHDDYGRREPEQEVPSPTEPAHRHEAVYRDDASHRELASPREEASRREETSHRNEASRREEATDSGKASDRADLSPRPAFEGVQPSETSPSLQSVHDRTSHTDRDAFRTRLQQHFLRRDVNETPFLLIAMRMDRTGERAARPFDFEFILDLASELLRDQDGMFVDLELERLIVLIADSRPEGAQRFFARLKNRLREEAPHQADHLLHSVSAIVVPDGRPFQNAEEFLTYALDES